MGLPVSEGIWENLQVSQVSEILEHQGVCEEKEIAVTNVEYIDFLVMLPAPRFTFVQDKFLWDSKCRHVVEDTGM